MFRRLLLALALTSTVACSMPLSARALVLLDVVDREPILPDNPLLSAKNCLITPHAAWLPIEVRRRLVDITAENLSAFLNHQHLNRVDLEG